MNATLNLFSRWLTTWRPRVAPSGLPYHLTADQVAALQALRSRPEWKVYSELLTRVGEQQASQFAAGLDHDKYLFSCGALTAVRRIFTLVDDLLATVAKLEEIKDDRTRAAAKSASRYAASFVNTPWYDGFRADRTD